MKNAAKIFAVAGVLLLSGCGGPCGTMPGPWWPDLNCGFVVL
jgi:hypothetical protein